MTLVLDVLTRTAFNQEKKVKTKTHPTNRGWGTLRLTEFISLVMNYFVIFVIKAPKGGRSTASAGAAEVGC